jgi:peptidyl-prolyl cis-trans isomerase SurA
MKEIGEISEPIKTPVGYHIVKLLDRKPRSSFEEEKGDIASVLKRGEWNFELYNSFDSRMKKEYGYTFYPERYAELQSICDLYFRLIHCFLLVSQKWMAFCSWLAGRA